jgi:hypothetical protein
MMQNSPVRLTEGNMTRRAYEKLTLVKHVGLQFIAARISREIVNGHNGHNGDGNGYEGNGIEG